MLLSVHITDKSFGQTELYHDLRFSLQAGETVGLVGRNGTGKSTLFHMITGDDKDYQGEIVLKRHAILINSRQEHHGLDNETVLGYIQGDLPEFARLNRILETYPATMGGDQHKIQTYSDALERFSQLGYYQIEDEIGQLFEAYQIDPARLHGRLGDLSGGQKRMVELVKVQRSRGDLALIDEPTNHMDSEAKAAFIGWLRQAPEAVLVITHDRDVLQQVDRIIDIRNGQAYAFRGNYDHYLRTNATQITSEVNEYDLTQRRIRNLTEDVLRFQRLKERSRDPGTIRRFKSQEDKARTELTKLQLVEKPSFWIDQESVGTLSTKMGVAYGKYKARNIRLDTRGGGGSERLLIQADKLVLGYDAPLFQPVSFQLRQGERIRLHGRNGAGKSTLVNAVMAAAAGTTGAAKLLGGSLSVEPETVIGHYEQEIAAHYLDLSLGGAIERALADGGQPVSEQRVQGLLSNYLFDPQADYDKPIVQLSGGQKARFQLIRLFVNEPQLLILDEPTNHLDLPSIEELEKALAGYDGAVIYISHDSYFATALGGTTIPIGA